MSTSSELAGIVNGHRVDNKLLRGGDVSAEGVDLLAKMGIVRVICLKNFKDDGRDKITYEQGVVEQAGLQFSHMPLNSSGFFSYDDIKLVPGILDKIVETQGQVFAHCHHGSDRTGVLVAIYRIELYDWSASQAIEEMKKYGNAWWNRGMREAVKHYRKTGSYGHWTEPGT